MKKMCLVRLDDFCPTMSYSSFQMALELLNTYNIKPLIGIIPNNIDKDQMIESEKDDYWEYVKKLQQNGYTFAMHGYHHIYDRVNSKTIVCGRKHSEFAGNNFDEQLKKIEEGKATLNRHGIYTDIFFAPAHSYDKSTLKALRVAGFKYISDGFSNKPYIQEGIKCIPCTSFGVPKKGKKGIIVAVCHPNEWIREDKAREYYDLKKYCENNKNFFVTFDELKTIKEGLFFFQKIVEKFRLLLLKFKRIVKLILGRR